MRRQAGLDVRRRATAALIADDLIAGGLERIGLDRVADLVASKCQFFVSEG